MLGYLRVVQSLHPSSWSPNTQFQDMRAQLFCKNHQFFQQVKQNFVFWNKEKLSYLTKWLFLCAYLSPFFFVLQQACLEGNVTLLYHADNPQGYGGKKKILQFPSSCFICLVHKIAMTMKKHISWKHSYIFSWFSLICSFN